MQPSITGNISSDLNLVNLFHWAQTQRVRQLRIKYNLILDQVITSAVVDDYLAYPHLFDLSMRCSDWETLSHYYVGWRSNIPLIYIYSEDSIDSEGTMDCIAVWMINPDYYTPAPPGYNNFGLPNYENIPAMARRAAFIKQKGSPGSKVRFGCVYNASDVGLGGPYKPTLHSGCETMEFIIDGGHFGEKIGALTADYPIIRLYLKNSEYEGRHIERIYKTLVFNYMSKTPPEHRKMDPSSYQDSSKLNKFMEAIFPGETPPNYVSDIDWSWAS